MSEDNKNQTNNDDLKDKEIERLKREKAATELKLRRSEEDLYDEDYLKFLQEQKKKEQPQNNFMSGGRLTDYSDEELQNLPLSKLTGLMMGEVYSKLKGEEQSKMTREQADKRKKKVAATRLEIKKFAKDYPDFWNYVDRIDELANENPNLNTEQLYVLAGGKLKEKEPPPKKDDDKGKEPPPDTRAKGEAGMKKDDSKLSMREVIAEEYQKLK